MVTVDAQTVKGRRSSPRSTRPAGRVAAPSGPSARSRSRSSGLPVAAHAVSARPHDVVAARELLRDRLDELPRLSAIVGDRAYRGLANLAARQHLALDVKAPPPGMSGFTPLWLLAKVEHAIA